MSPRGDHACDFNMGDFGKFIEGGVFRSDEGDDPTNGCLSE